MPLVGLADEIVDLVETGSTLKANDLVAKDLIANISCRLVAMPHQCALSMMVLLL